jgi:hypothetical protein
MKSIADLEEYKALSNEDKLELDKYHLFEPSFIMAKKYMKENKINQYS